MKTNREYVPADTSFIVNCGDPNLKELDPSLIPIRISLPSPPNLKLIDGYGLDPKDQFWRRPEYPEKLLSVEKMVKRDLDIRASTNKNERVTGYKILDEIWNRIEADLDYYKKEILWIKKQWWHRYYGYWFFNNGKPTYICGWHYFYLTFWKIEGRIYPEYRDRDRKNFLFWWYSKNTKEAFTSYDKQGNALLNSEDKFVVEEMPNKVSYGVAQPKNRRGGTTNMSQCAQYEDTSKMTGALAAMFSLSEESAFKLFTGKTVKSWAQMPFFFLPTWSGYFDEKNSIEFKRPKNIILGNQLNSIITYAKSAFGAEFDGERITFAIFDESGKVANEDVTARWDVHRQGMSVADGADIVGFSIHPSTVEDMDTTGGAHYQNLIYASNFYQRNPTTGQTKSGLFTLFFPGYEGLEGFIGKYGESIIDDPTPQQIADGFKFRHGSRKHLQSNRDQLLTSKDPRDQIKYRRLVVKYPFTLDECFKLSVGSGAWSMEIIDRRLAELRRIKEPFVRGNFEFLNGVKTNKVIWVPKDDGKFEMSISLTELQTNQKVKVLDVDPITFEYIEVWKPLNSKFTLAADPFKYKGDKNMAITTGNYMSDGGIAVLWDRDPSIDPDEKPIQNWDSFRFVISYRNRTNTTKEFFEDVLKCAIYFGAMIYPETNVENLWNYIVEEGYGGYLLYDWDEAAKAFKKRPGCYSIDTSKEDIFDGIRNYIDLRGNCERHASILKEIAAVKQFTDMNKNDLFAAAGLALRGVKMKQKTAYETVDDGKQDYSWWLEF